MIGDYRKRGEHHIVRMGQGQEWSQQEKAKARDDQRH